MTVLRAGLATPVSGPLGGFGRAGAAALALWSEEAHGLGAPWRAVTLTVEDAHPDPAAAVARVLQQPTDILFGPYGSSPALAVAGATGRLVWNHGGATSSLRRPAYPHVVNLLAPASTYFHGALAALAAMGRRPDVLVVHTLTGFATDVASGTVAEARRLGFPVHAHVLVPAAPDLGLDRLPEADVCLVAGGFEEERAAAPRLVGRRWMALGFVGAGVDEVLAPLGPGREGLLGPAQWIEPGPAGTSGPADVDHEGSDQGPQEGPDAAWFAVRYRARTGSDPPYPAAQAFAAGVVAARCVRDADGPDDDRLLAAARALQCRTLFGAFRLDPGTGLQVGHRVLTVQWQEGRRRVVWPLERAERPLLVGEP